MVFSFHKFYGLLFFMALWSYASFSQCTTTTATEPFPNGDFNTFTPPSACGQTSRASGWFQPSAGSSDLFSVGGWLGGDCGIPRVNVPSPNGGAWVGIGYAPAYGAEYVARRLDTPLTTGMYNMVVDLGAPEDEPLAGVIFSRVVSFKQYCHGTKFMCNTLQYGDV